MMTSKRTFVQSLLCSLSAGIDDLDLDVFIFVVFFVIVNKSIDGGESEGRYKDTSGGVAGFGAEVDTDAVAFGYVAYLRHGFAKTR